MTPYPRDADLRNGSCRKGERERTHQQNNIKKSISWITSNKSCQTSNYSKIIPLNHHYPTIQILATCWLPQVKRLLISESCGDLNQCTPSRGKHDTHNTYASRTSPRIPLVCFLWAVPIRGNLSWSHQHHWTELLLLRKKVPIPIHSTLADRSMSPYPVSLAQQPLKQ
jgi:hypothetical protein